MVLEGMVANLLSKYLGDYILGLKKENLKLAVGNGQINLKNLEINPEALAEINLPMTIKKGTLGSLNLKIPWSNLSGQSTIVQIEDLCLLIIPKMNEYDENWESRIQTTKQKRLKLNEMMKSEQTEPKKEEKKGWTETFTSGIVEKVLNNLQIEVKRIHIRYEDDVSNIGKPFAFGITLDYLQVQSADENWNPSFITEAKLRLYKLVNLKGLAIYWNTNEKFVDWNKDKVEDALSSFSKAMTDLIPSEGTDQKHNYLLEPVNASLKVVLNKEEGFNLDVPKITFDFIFEKIGVSINELQYKDLLITSEFYASTIKNQKYKHLKPKDLPNNKKNYKQWWHYLVDSVLLEYRENKKIWNWKFLKQHVVDRKQYIDLWYKKKGKIKTDDNLLDEMEKRLSFETIASFRELGDALFLHQKLKSEQKANEENSKKGFFGKMLNSTKAKLEEKVEINNKTLKELYGQINETEDKKTEAKRYS